MKLFIALMLITFNAFAYEVNCYGNFYSFYVQEEDGLKVGTITAASQTLGRVQMFKTPVDKPEYEKLKALYEGETSQDIYKLYVFKEKEKGEYISFLETESKLGHKKVTELRCKL